MKNLASITDSIVSNELHKHCDGKQATINFSLDDRILKGESSGSPFCFQVIIATIMAKMLHEICENCGDDVAEDALESILKTLESEIRVLFDIQNGNSDLGKKCDSLEEAKTLKERLQEAFSKIGL